MADKESVYSLLDAEDEKQLLQLIKNRFTQDQVCNFLDDVAVAINPCKDLSRESWDLHQIADCAICHLKLHQKSQCIVLTGDSGSGKTENAKKFITRIINSVSKTDDELANNITQAGTVLESFGNASTSMCDNASRYIKFTELLFTQDTKLKGAYIHHYLLEKTRVVHHNEREGTFHIFYQFLAGTSEEDLKKYQLQKSACYRYIGSSFDWTIDQEKYQEELHKVKECFQSLGFSEENLDTIFRILAAILHVGDLSFAVDGRKKKAGVIHLDPLRNASQLLRISPERLECALVTELTQVKGKVARHLRRVKEAEEARDKLAMALYARLFAWIVWKINQYLTPIDQERSESSVVSIFDPFGFEHLERNGIEQLCINTTNEHLAYLYNQCVFAWEMEDQETEGILIQKVSYSSNKEIVDFLMERPEGIFAVIDRQTIKTIHGTDASLVKKLSSKHRKHSRYEDVSNCPYPAFTVSHYAGKVTYTALNMLNKNRNMLGGSIILCLQDSADELLGRLFMVKLSSTGAISTVDDKKMAEIQAMPGKAQIKKMRGTMRRKTEMIGSIQGFSKSKQSKRKVIQEQAHLTLTSQLRNSLSDMMQRFLKSDLHFVRCIRPNRQLIPYDFDDELVKAQLRYSGIMETVLMRQQGFPVRMAFGPFIDRYKILAYRLTMEVKYAASTCEKILWSIDGLEWKVAKTKVFMKNSCRDQLDNRLCRIKQGIVIIQTLFRGRRARRKYRVLQFQKQREQAIVKDFLTKVEGRMDIVYNHLYNQVSEEDGRANTTKVGLFFNQDEVKERALGILTGKKEKRITKNPSPRQPAINTYSREATPTSSTPDLPTDQDEPEPEPIVEALNISTDGENTTLNLDQRSGSESDEGQPTPQTPEENPSDSPQLFSISDIFDLGPEPRIDPVPPVSSTSSDDTSDNNLDSPEPINSITDVFSSENIDRDQQHPSQSSLEDEIIDKAFMEIVTDFSITDVFNDSPTDVIIATSPVCDMTSVDRPSLVGRESNLSTVSFESQDIDDDMKIAMKTPGLWCTITCYERDILRVEFRVDRPVIIVDGSSNAFDVTRIGLGSIPMTPGDDKVEKVRRCVGKGIKLMVDEEGNMWVKRCSKNNVFVKGYYLAPEVIAVKGVLPKGKLLKIFDFNSFADHLNYECDPRRYEPGKGEELLSSIKVCICFVKDAEQDIDALCWIEVEMTEPSRITRAALDLAKDLRKKEREKRGDRTPPILRAKIGKSRQVIAVDAWEKKVRPKYYIDSFKYRRRGWARKKVSVNPFEFGSQDLVNKEKSEDLGPRTQSYPADLENLMLNDEFGVDEYSDEVFESSSERRSVLKAQAVQGDNPASGAGSTKAKRLTRANTDDQIPSQSKAVEDGKKVWAKEKVKERALHQQKRIRRSRSETTS